MKFNDIKFDCKFFKGNIPCKPNKELGVICSDCNHYEPIKNKILIIKLGAAGDVIRTTPIIQPLRKKYPSSKIYWLTYFPELVPSQIDEILEFNQQNILYLQNINFDVVINLDKDNEAISLTKILWEKTHGCSWNGFTMDDNGNCEPFNGSKNKFITGLFDSESKANTKNYVEEIFEMCELKYERQEYILDKPENKFYNKIDKPYSITLPKDSKIIGINTGCGKRWESRQLSLTFFIELIKNIPDNYGIVLLGGKQEDDLNKDIIKYFSFFNSDKEIFYYGFKENIKDFILYVDICDVIITQVTMAVHIAIALKKHVILLNNIFNKNEFDLYDRGIIIEPEKECKCYFKPKCENDYECIKYFSIKKIIDSIPK